MTPLLEALKQFFISRASYFVAVIIGIVIWEALKRVITYGTRKAFTKMVTLPDGRVFTKPNWKGIAVALILVANIASIVIWQNWALPAFTIVVGGLWLILKLRKGW